ncbi:MAG: hypothetical protein Q9209_003879 [Squamulea sp. 1 TL-2023]
MPQPVPHIQVIGSLNIDLITRTSRLPEPGETLSANSFNYSSGGKGANQAVACARLSRSKLNHDEASVDVEMNGAVGDDFFGNYLLESLRESGVGVERVRKVEGERTGTAVVLVEEESGENRILITAGANALVTPPKLDSLDQARELPDLIVLQLEVPVSTVVEIVKDARRRGIDVLLNPAPAVELPKVVFEGLGHLVMNQGEVEVLSRSIDHMDKDGVEDEGDNSRKRNMQDTCERFHALGVTNVIITLGSNGVYYSFRKDAEGWGEGRHVPAAKVEKVVDTTAAGDTFVGAYAVAIVRGASTVDAVKWANKAAAKTVEREGAQDAIPWEHEVEPLFTQVP